jgi:antagonist of KipI
MSIQIIKKGLSDSIQDNGRYGYQHLGIQPNGCMDIFSAWAGNYILQNNLSTPVIELHFPSSTFQFDSDYIICITGANFVPVINEKSVELYTPLHVKQNDILSMLQPIEGRTAYLAIQGTLNDTKWLNSHAYTGKRLEKGQILDFKSTHLHPPLKMDQHNDLIEKIHAHVFDHQNPIRFIPGPAWKDLDQNAAAILLEQPFTISPQANRMGFHLNGPKINLSIPNAYLSSAVTRGSLQLLPNGNIIVLMADHQTIGGYANLGQIILVDLPRFAQMKAGQPFHFSSTNLENAHQLYWNLYESFQH